MKTITESFKEACLMIVGMFIMCGLLVGFFWLVIGLWVFFPGWAQIIIYFILFLMLCKLIALTSS